jgi:LEA14-like dessication related protein
MSSARPLFLAAALALAACSPPEPPTVTPVSAKVQSISPSGITVEAKLEAYNPNDFDITARSFTATVTLDKSLNIGTVTSQHSVTLPAKKKTRFDVPIPLQWQDVTYLAPLALSNRDVPFEAEGKVKASAKSVDLEMPFKVSGIVTHKQIQQAVGSAIPKVPGLPGLPF